VMPQMGESIVEGTLTKWLKKPGERVERDEPLFEISTDKVDTEIPSPAAGTLSEVLVQEGATVGINTVVARIDEGGGAAAAPPAVKAEPAAEAPAQETVQPTPAPEQVEEPAPTPAPPTESTPAPTAEPAGPLSPLVRKMARENNIDLGKVKGTGAGGRITKQDLEAYLAKQAPAPAAEAARAGEGEDNPAFRRLNAAVEPLAENVSGVGLDVPAWVRRLEESLRAAKAHDNSDGDEPIRHTSALDFEELRRQLADWDRPLGE